MAKISYRLVFNRNNKLNAQGKALIQVEAYLERRKIYFSTHIHLKPNQWNRKKCMVVRHPEADALNYYLQESMMKLEQKEMEIWRRGREVTLEILKQELNPEEEHSFLSFVREEIASSTMKESTRKNRNTTLQLLSQYKPHLAFDEVTSGFIHDFEKFMYKKGLEMNTVAKHLKHLRIFVNTAIRQECMNGQSDPFRGYKIKTAPYKHVFLLPEEVGKLENLKLADVGPSLEHTLDAFLFCIYTGLRYSDFIALSEKNMVEIEGNSWIIFHSVKTGVEVKLPVYLLFEGKACRLLGKYEGNWKHFFGLKSNTSVNYDLETIGKIAGIGKHFTFHSARHTNATLLIDQGVSITTIQKLLGHRNVSTTQVYAEIMGKTIVKDLMKTS